VKRLVASGRSDEARGGADGAQSEIDLFYPSVGNHKEPQENRRDDGEDSAKNPRATGHRGCYPDAGGGIRGNHLPHRNQEEHDRMHQCDDGAFAVRENGKSTHTYHTVPEVADMRL